MVIHSFSNQYVHLWSNAFLTTKHTGMRITLEWQPETTLSKWEGSLWHHSMQWPAQTWKTERLISLRGFSWKSCLATKKDSYHWPQKSKRWSEHLSLVNKDYWPEKPWHGQRSGWCHSYIRGASHLTDLWGQLFLYFTIMYLKPLTALFVQIFFH